MSSLNPEQSPENLDGTIDEDNLLSEQVNRLKPLQYRKLFTEVAENQKTISPRLTYTNAPKLSLQSEKRRLQKSSTIKADSTNVGLFFFPESQENLNENGKTKLQTKKSILKSETKSKYSKWHIYQRGMNSARLDFKSNLDKGLIAPYFMKGSQDLCSEWDDQRWKKEQEWWERAHWQSHDF